MKERDGKHKNSKQPPTGKRLIRASMRCLRETRKLIKKGWFNRDFPVSALDKDGKPVNSTSDKAVKWTLTGAIHKATSEEHWSVVHSITATLIRCIPDKYFRLDDWNDYKKRKRSDVIRLIDKAYERLGGRL